MRRARTGGRGGCRRTRGGDLVGAKISSSATRPPKRLANIALISIFDWLYLSRSGRNIVTPQGAAARDDRDLVQRLVPLGIQHAQRVAALVDRR